MERKYLVEVRDYIFDHPEIIDSYVEENSKKFSNEELTIELLRNSLYMLFYIISKMFETFLSILKT